MLLENNRALVIGASSGIGAACAEGLAAQGYRVGLVARRQDALQAVCERILSRNGHGPGPHASPEQGPKALVFPMDVSQFDQIPEKFDEIVSQLGGLDLVIYAAGVMPEMGSDEYAFSKDRQMIEVNLMGAMAWLNQAAEFFSRVKHGTLVGISSIAGDRGRKGNPAYCSSKAALNTYLESLRNRLDAFGVHVLTVKPGFVDTAMTRGKPGLFWLITAQEAARQIIRAVDKKKNTVYVPRRWRLVGLIIRSIPSFIFRKLDL